ncbi:hypothetical protein HDU96_010415, partial [Phlyctochytrium bullatum]
VFNNYADWPEFKFQKPKLVGQIPYGLRASADNRWSAAPRSPTDLVIVPGPDRSVDPDTLTVRVLDNLEYVNGIIYQTYEGDWVEFERKHRNRKNLILLHGNFGGVHWENKLQDAYIRYSWDKMISKEEKKCQCGFFERMRMVDS